MALSGVLGRVQQQRSGLSTARVEGQARRQWHASERVRDGRRGCRWSGGPQRACIATRASRGRRAQVDVGGEGEGEDADEDEDEERVWVQQQWSATID